MHIIIEKWEEILERVKEEHELTEVSFKTWLQPLTIIKASDTSVTILVPTEQIGLDYVTKKYSIPLRVAIEEITGCSCTITFVLKDDEPEKPVDLPTVAGLNPKYTFDTFVVGSNNKFAHAASLAVAESPGDTYNPLFLYGGVGLGKTHLMHSIAHFINQSHPEMQILYVTSEQFTYEVIEAIRNGNNSSINNFREKYRKVDVLLIDDVQFIIGKESTQEEFFHTFNTLHAAGKQIILSSDRPPKDMDILEERIRSRFEWGLMADIQSPDYETRMAILRKKQETDGLIVRDDVIEYIAENVKSNIRELEGSLNKVVALANLEKRPVTLDLAEKALIDMISPHESKVITAEYILDLVAEHFEVSIEDLKGDKRSRKFTYPRQVFMYLCREMTTIKLESIGKYLGGKDHTTVLHGIKRIEQDYKEDIVTKNMVDILKKKIIPTA